MEKTTAVECVVWLPVAIKYLLVSSVFSPQPGWIDSRQIEAARRAMTRFIKRGGKVWIRIFPDKPITKHPAESRMGKGKGAPEGWVAVVRPGTVMFEMAGVKEEIAREAMRLAAQKLSVQTRFLEIEK